MTRHNDPVYMAIIAAKINLVVVDVTLSKWLHQLRPVDKSASCPDVSLSGMDLCYNRDFIKSLTNSELKETLIQYASLLQARHSGNPAPVDGASDCDRDLN
jgi:hypothetical protein